MEMGEIAAIFPKIWYCPPPLQLGYTDYIFEELSIYI